MIRDEYLVFDLKRVAHLIPTLADWHQQEWSHLNPGETLQERIARMHEYLNDEDIPTMLVAVNAAGDPLGTAMLDINDMNTNETLTPWLASVFVHPDFRRQGIAAQLLAEVHRLFERIDYEQYYLYTEDQEDYYAARGWTLLERTFYQGHPVSVMHRAT